MENSGLFWGLMGSMIALLVIAAIVLIWIWIYYFKVKKQVQEGTYLSKHQKQEAQKAGVDLNDKEQIKNYLSKIIVEQTPIQLEEIKETIVLTDNLDTSNSNQTNVIIENIEFSEPKIDLEINNNQDLNKDQPENVLEIQNETIEIIEYENKQ